MLAAAARGFAPGGGLRPHVEVALDHPVVEDGAALAVVRRPALPLLRVHGLQVVEVREHVLRVLGVHHLLHAPDLLGALLRVELLALLLAELVVLGVRPVDLVPPADLAGGEALQRRAGIVVAVPEPEDHVVVGRRRVALPRVHRVAGHAVVDDLEADLEAEVLEPPGEELALALGRGRLGQRPQAQRDGLALLVLADAVAVGVPVAGGVQQFLRPWRGRTAA